MEHAKQFDVYAVGGITGKVDRTRSVKVCTVNARGIKDAEKQGQRFCNLVSSTMTHIKQAEVKHATNN